MANTDENRRVALNNAVHVHGFDAVMDRLEFLKNDNEKYADQTESDICYLVNTFGPRRIIDTSDMLHVSLLMDETVRTIHAGLSMNDIEIVQLNTSILEELVNMMKNYMY
jgi:hypothetical protein